MKFIKKIFKEKTVRNRIILTLGLLFIFRLGSVLTLPGISINSLQMSDSTTELISLINMLGGGSLDQFSIFALGVSPYITASIIIELLSMDVIPAFTRWKKEGGDKSKAKLNKATIITTILLAIIQSAAILYSFDVAYGILMDNSLLSYAYIVTLMLTGTLIALWIGNQITQKGFGNGVSLLIFSGIVANLPQNLLITYNNIVTYKDLWSFAWFGVFMFIYLFMIFFVIFIEGSERKIPIIYAGSSRITNPDKNYLPLKVNTAGVIPVIFASSLLVSPRVIISFFPNSPVYSVINAVCNYQQPLGFAIYITLTFVFAYFYANLQVDPKKTANDLRKNGGSIPGVRTGEDTKKFIQKTLNRITFYGAISLMILAAVPIILPLIWEPASLANVQLGGTSLIIMTSVAIETSKKIIDTVSRQKYTQNYNIFKRG